MDDNLRNAGDNFLCNAFLTLETTEECAAFLKDLLTPQERHAIVQRFVIAKMLSQKHSYADIIEKTGASTIIIARVKHSMTDSAGGYDTIFSRLPNELL
jgi:TrpR-related protein YerC/YecD